MRFEENNQVGSIEMKVRNVFFSVLSALVLSTSFAQAHQACAVNSNPASPGYGKLFCSSFPDGGAAVNPTTQRVSCGRGACAVNVAPSSPGYLRVYCSAFQGGGAAVNASTGKVSCGKGACHTASNG